jgi:hypothetical protein
LELKTTVLCEVTDGRLLQLPKLFPSPPITAQFDTDTGGSLLIPTSKRFPMTVSNAFIQEKQSFGSETRFFCLLWTGKRVDFDRIPLKYTGAVVTLLARADSACESCAILSFFSEDDPLKRWVRTHQRQLQGRGRKIKAFDKS